MSKSQDQESIDKIKQQLDEEYQNLTYLETGWAALGIETGNTKYDELNKKYLDLNKGNLGIIQTVTQAVSDGASALQFTWEAAQVLPDLLTEFNNLKAAKNAADSAGSIEAGSKMIQDAESLIKKCAGILHSESISDSSKEAILESTIIPYVLTPILNKRFGKITKNFQTSETEKINVLDGISPKFIRELSTLRVDIISKALESDLNPKVQGIYKNIKQKNESSQANILQNIREIITSDQVSPALKKDLVNFLKKPESQKEIAQFAENIINNKVQKFANPELIVNTVALLANSSDKFIESVPAAIDALNQFKANQRWSNTNLNMAGLDTASKKDLLAAKKPEVVELVKNAKIIIDNLSPVLEKELPKYLKDNQENILAVLNNSKVKEKIASSGKDPEFIHKAAKASMPFLQDAMPSITKIANLALSDSDKVADIMQKAALIKSLPKEEKKEELKALLSTLIEIKNNNPEINKIIEKDIPNLLTTHADKLGPVVQEFLDTKPIGQKLKLEGKKLVELAGKHAPELIKIADKINKREYGGVIVPAFKLLADPKVLGLVAKSIVNLGTSTISKKPVGPHTNKVLEERQNNVGKQTSRGV
ncbi:hypothetical protein A1I_06745 [Rickettsia bellii OSU 85-389]|uniref:hypothetical protein n=1 Tax=Rickettsia bellii TaxID=33990 RepID=UPI0000DB104F|nr:hypothetical protein [Rickettsia bellii]ABV79665.1 hypothetical protein A1I_06745 [Rickettsia bellii OSU 85-389]